MFYLPNYVFYIFLSPKGRTGSNKIFIGMPIIPIFILPTVLCFFVKSIVFGSIAVLQINEFTMHAVNTEFFFKYDFLSQKATSWPSN